jgi:TDG/mug DNA glycosylase family protein
MSEAPVPPDQVTRTYWDALRRGDRAVSSEPTLPDILAQGLDVVFVGINPSIYSVEQGHYFARPGNRFWTELSESGLVPERLGPRDDGRLPSFGLGLTDVVKRPTVRADELSEADCLAARPVLREKLLWAAPRIVCFVGLEGYRCYSGNRAVRAGQQAERIGRAVVVVMPSTSGRAARYYAERRRCLQAIAGLLGRA